jgi:hypothetical protein
MITEAAKGCKRSSRQASIGTTSRGAGDPDHIGIDINPLRVSCAGIKQHRGVSRGSMQRTRVEDSRCSDTIIANLVGVPVQENVNRCSQQVFHHMIDMSMGDTDATLFDLDDRAGVNHVNPEVLRVSRQRVFVVTIAKDDGRLDTREQIENRFVSHITKMNDPSGATAYEQLNRSARAPRLSMRV